LLKKNCGNKAEQSSISIVDAINLFQDTKIRFFLIFVISTIEYQIK